MDIKSFSDESFDPVSWINKSFDRIGIDVMPENHAAGLVYKLQLFLQEINQSLEETAQQVIRSLPFVLKQTESLEDELQSARDGLALIQTEMSAMRGSAEAEDMKRLHVAVNNMQLFLKQYEQRQEQRISPLNPHIEDLKLETSDSNVESDSQIHE